jgi:hypothetical protein
MVPTIFLQMLEKIIFPLNYHSFPIGLLQPVGDVSCVQFSAFLLLSKEEWTTIKLNWEQNIYIKFSTNIALPYRIRSKSVSSLKAIDSGRTPQ